LVGCLFVLVRGGGIASSERESREDASEKGKESRTGRVAVQESDLQLPIWMVFDR